LISLINRALKSNEIEIGGIDIRESYTIFEIDERVKKDLINEISKIDFKGDNLSIKETNETVEKKFSKQKKKKSYSSRRNRNRSERVLKSRVKFSDKRKNKKKKNRF